MNASKALFLTAGLSLAAAAPSAAQTHTCAEHFTVSTEGAIGPGSPAHGSIGNRPIKDSYMCVVDPEYPPRDSCPAGMKVAGLYFSGSDRAPYYYCVVYQQIGGPAPAGCPIGRDKLQCAAGFELDELHSQYSWRGPNSDWGCIFACKVVDDPRPSNPEWPCTSPGYRIIGGGGDHVECASY